MVRLALQCSLLITLLLMLIHNNVEATQILREQFPRAEKGDYIVTTQGKNFTLLHIYDHEGDVITIEEITVPASRYLSNFPSWRDWVRQNAPGHTCWVLYRLNMRSGQLEDFYSYTRGGWHKIQQVESFLPTLLALNFQPIPLKERRRTGGVMQNYWQPRMIVDGQTVPGVAFSGWKARWPKDSSELSGKLIEIYLPEDSAHYPAYFPYWLQISGMIGSAKVRIMDSGKGLISPMLLPRK